MVVIFTGILKYFARCNVLYNVWNVHVYVDLHDCIIYIGNNKDQVNTTCVSSA